MAQRFGWTRPARHDVSKRGSKSMESWAHHHEGEEGKGKGKHAATDPEKNGTPHIHDEPPEIVEDDDAEYLHHQVPWWYLEWFCHASSLEEDHKHSHHQHHRQKPQETFHYEESDFAGRTGCAIVDEAPKRVHRLSRRFSFAAVSTEVVMIIMGTISYIVYHGVLAFSVKTPVDNRTYDDEVVLPDSSVDLVTQDITLLQVLFAFWFVATIFNSIVHIQLALAHYNEKVIQAKASSNFSLTLLHILKYFNMTQALIRLISQPPAMWQCHNLSCVRNYFLSISSVNSLVYT